MGLPGSASVVLFGFESLRLWIRAGVLRWLISHTWSAYPLSFSPREMRLYMVNISSSLTEGGMGDR